MIVGSLAVLAFIATALIALTGGIGASVGGLKISARDPYRAYYVGVMFGCLELWRIDRRSHVPSWNRLTPIARWFVVLTALCTVAVGIGYGAFVAGGADAYGYVSEALLWSNGHLTVAEPLARITPSLGASVAPLGYRLAADSRSIVPIYPPGLPLLMAPVVKLAGFSAVFVVVPIFGALAVWLTYVIGTHVGDARSALMAAVLLACSPIFLLQLMQPMSDVPVTTFWLAALAIVILQPTSRGAFFSGLVASGAVLIRPNLVPLAGVVLLIALTTSPRLRRGLAFTLGVIPGAVGIAAFNWELYGSPLTSGYGPNATLFSIGWISTNLQRYPMWLLQLQTVFVFVAVLAPALPSRGGTPTQAPRRLRGYLLLFVAVLLACYLPYIPFDTWPFLRFLLPGIPLLLILSSVSAVWFITLAPVRLRGVIFAAACAFLCAHYVHRAGELNIFHDAESQHRYRAVAEYVDRTLPKNALVITVIQSGSLRLYGHRQTLRWDVIEPDAFDQVIRTLYVNGYVPYILLEGSEEAIFHARFEQTQFGTLDWPPVAEYDRYERVRIYSADERTRSRSDSRIDTVRIQP